MVSGRGGPDSGLWSRDIRCLRRYSCAAIGLRRFEISASARSRKAGSENASAHSRAAAESFSAHWWRTAMAASSCRIPGSNPDTNCAAATGSDLERTKEALADRRSRHGPGGCARAHSRAAPGSFSHHCMVRHSSNPPSMSSSAPPASASTSAWDGSSSARARQTVERAERRAAGSSSDEAQVSAASGSRAAHSESNSRTRASRTCPFSSVNALASFRAGSRDSASEILPTRWRLAAVGLSASSCCDRSGRTKTKALTAQRPPAAIHRKAAMTAYREKIDFLAPRVLVDTSKRVAIRFGFWVWVFGTPVPRSLCLTGWSEPTDRPAFAKHDVSRLPGVQPGATYTGSRLDQKTSSPVSWVFRRPRCSCSERGARQDRVHFDRE